MNNFSLVITNEDGSTETLYEPTPKQLLFHEREENNVLFYGGRGSGKSVALRWEAHIRAMTTPGFLYVVLRRTFPELQRSHLIYLPGEMRKLGGTFLASKNIAVYPNGSKGFFSHCSTEQDVLDLLGSQFYWAGFDELSTFPWEMFMKLATSIRVPKELGLPALVRACTNPLGPSSQEILHYFVDRDVPLEESPDYNPNDWYAVKANIEDNPYLDRADYMKRFVGLSNDVRKAWIDGEFSLENAMFNFQPTIIVPNPDAGEGGEGGVPAVIKRPYHVISELPTYQGKPIIETIW